jgi:hypothetical protein
MTPDKLKAFFQERQPTEGTPLMLDESYFPEKGTVTTDQVPGGIPMKGATVNPQGKAVAPIQGMKVGAKTVAQPIKPEVQAVAEAAPKVESSKVQQIVQEMRDAGASQVSQETAVPQAPAQTGLEGIDLKAIREKVGKEGESASLSDLLVGLIPVALDAASGGQGFALGGAGEYYTGKAKDIQTRNRTLEDKLMAYQQARSVASAKNKNTSKLATASNLVKVDTPDGPKWQWAGQAAGMGVPTEMKGNTLEGKLLLQKNSQDFRNKEEEEKRKIAAGTRFQQKLEMDPTFQDYKAQQVQSQRALELLAQGLGVADAGARTTFAKGIFGEVGNLAVQEQTAVSGSPALQQKWETLWKKYSEGTLGDQDRADMIEVASAIRARAPGIIAKLANQKAVAEQQISGQDVSAVAAALSKDVTTGQVKVKVVYNGRIKNINIEDFPAAVRDYKAKLFTGKE